MSEEMRNLLEYIDGRLPSDAFTQELDEEVRKIRQNDEWRVDYMTLAMKFQEKYAEGKEEGRMDMLVELVKDGSLTAEDAARILKISVEQFSQYLNE